MDIISYNEYSNGMISENLKYHIDNNISILGNVFRPGSDAFYALIEEGRKNKDKIALLDIDQNLYNSSNLGLFEYYEGELVPLDLPIEIIDFVNEADYKGKAVSLNKPMRSSGPKKYKVYVKNPKTGKVIVVNFGDVKGGLKSKINDPEARRNFAKRHDCKNKKDKAKAGYWACRLPRYAHLLGMNTSFNGYW